MSAPAFTPGPWNHNPPTREHPSEAMVSACSGGVDIYRAPLTRETEANARLIAAAPELYDLAQGVIAFNALSPGIPLELVQLASAALAKAESK